MDLGATPLQAFLLVALPAIAPALASAYLMTFTLSLDDLVIASFATGPGATTLPMRIYSQVRLGVTPEVNAVSPCFSPSCFSCSPSRRCCEDARRVNKSPARSPEAGASPIH